MFKKIIFSVKSYVVEKLKLNVIKLGKVYYNDKEDVAILLKDGLLKVYVGGKLLELSTKNIPMQSLKSSEKTLEDLSIEQLQDLLHSYEEEGEYFKCAEIRDIIKSKLNVKRINE